MTASVLLSLSILADGPYVLNVSESGGNQNAWTDCTKWNDTSSIPLTMWDAEGDYIVSGKRYFRSPNTNSGEHTFDANSLKIGDRTSQGTFRVYTIRPASLVFPNDGLILERGTITTEWSRDKCFDFVGKVRVTDTTADGFSIVGSYLNATVTFADELSSVEGALLSFGSEIKTVGLKGDCSDYLGTLRLGQDGARLEVGGQSFGGTVVFGGKNQMLVPNCSWQVESLQIGEGSVISLGGTGTVTATSYSWRNHSVTVANAFSVSVSPATVRVQDSALIADGKTSRIVLLTLPYGTSAVKEDFVVETSDIWPNPQVEFELDEAAQVKRLVLKYEPVVLLLKSDSHKADFGSNGKAGGVDGIGTCLTNDVCWSDSLRPHAGVHYLICDEFTINNEMDGYKVFVRTPSRCEGGNASKSTYTFPGDSLTIGHGCSLTVLATTFNCRKLRLLDGSCFRNGQWTSVTIPNAYQDGETNIANTMEVPSGTVKFAQWGDCSLYCNSMVTGSALLNVRKAIQYSSAPYGSTAFNGDMTGFDGTFKVEMSKTDGTSFVKQILYWNYSIGSNLPELNPQAFAVADGAELQVMLNVTIPTTSNRGLYFGENKGQLLVAEDFTLTVGTPVTVNGTWIKNGAGTLVLGGEARFGSAAETEPDDGKDNLFEVNAGKVCVASAGALDGLRIKMFVGSTLDVLIDPSKADFKRYGLKNVKTTEPFSLDETLTKLPLTVTYPADFELTDPITFFGIVTVTNAAAESVEAMLPAIPIRKIKGYHGTLVRRSEDGVTTFGINYVRLGLRFIVR